MVSAKLARDNFINTYGSDMVDDRLLRLWCNDCAKKFISVESTSYPKAKLLDIEYQTVDLGEDFNRVIQVWFAPGELQVNRYEVLDKIAEVCGTEKEYKDKCTGKVKKKCSVEINSPVDYFADPTLSAMYAITKKLVGFSDTIKKVSTDTNFLYVKPSIRTMDFAKYVIPCYEDNSNDLVYKIEDNKLSISYPEGVALVLYYAIPMDNEGYVMFPDKSEFWEAINSYVVYKYSETEYIKDHTPTNERFWKNMEFDYLKKLGLAKKELNKIVDIKKFMSEYKDVTERVLGRKYNENPLEIK